MQLKLPLRPAAKVAPKPLVLTKVNKPVLKLPPKPAQKQLAFNTEESATREQAAEKVRQLARGFRLQFKSLGNERTLKDEAKRQLIEGRTDADMDQMRITKHIYAPHPELKKVGQAQRKVRDYFESRTLPFPDDSVRLFMVSPPENSDRLSEAELDAAMAAQTNVFREEMRKQIAEYEQVVLGVQTNWADILEKAREKLNSQFDITIYPTKEQIPQKLQCTFNAYNLDLSRDWKHLSPAERDRELAAVRQSFESAVAKQEEFVISLLESAIDQFVTSVSNYNTKESRCFKDSVVERVFDAFTEFQSKTVKYGILKGTQVESLFKKVRDVMKEGGTDKKTLPDLLRKSGERREDMIAKMSQLQQSLTQIAEGGRAKRRLL